MKYLCLLVAQTCMAHFRLDFFLIEQRHEVHANWNFLFTSGFQKKVKEGDLRT